MNPLAFLTALPPRAYLALAVVLTIAAAAVGHVIDVKVHERRADAAGYARAKGEWDAEKVRQQAAALKAQQDNAAETERRLTEHQEIVHAAEKRAEQARADAVAAGDAAQQLRRRVAELAAGRGGAASDPTSTVDRAPDADAAGMLANVLGQCTARVQRLAEYADRAATAGSACERSYEALTPDP